ncbi:TonB family protein [Alteromonadaceae bacterium 2753L.S.0a.02]|nr:TonB family protein [Alteromonadaceae bacterium 2753L.S.0a.02]
MKFITLLLAGSLMASSLVYGNDEAAQAKSKFKAAYKKYKECVAAQDVQCTAEQAELAFKQGVKVIPLDSKNAAALLYNYGLAVLNDTTRGPKRSVEAYKLLEQALPLNEKHFGKDSPQVLALLTDLTSAQVYEKDSEKNKKRYWQQAVELSEKINGDASIEHAMVLMETGSVMMNSHGYDIYFAKRYLNDAYDIFRKELGDTHPYTGFVAFNLGKYKMAQGKNRSATDYFEQALVAFEGDDGYRNRYSLTAHGFLVQTYESLGKSDEATEHCLAIGKSQPPVANDEYYPLFKQAPAYPEAAARSKQEGTVIYEYTVTEQGFTKDHKLIEWTGSKLFVEPSLEAVKKFRYAPQFVDGKPVPVQGVRNRFNFVMGG